MPSGGRSNLSRFRLVALALAAIIVGGGSAAQPALASHYKQLNGDPLTVFIGSDGWFQELVDGNTSNSFFPSLQPQTSDVSANAGFVLAFPAGQSGTSTNDIEGQVWGWAHDEGASGLDFDDNFSPVSQGNWAGAGTTPDPYTQVTVYEVKPVATALVRVTQTTTYVNGESNFVTSYAVDNLTSDPLTFRALVGADVYLNGSDCGTGVFKTGPPRFVGGSSLGRVGGFTEAATPWTRYFEGWYGGPGSGCDAPSGQGVWQYLEGAESGPGFPNTIDPAFVDNGVGIQWDTHFTTPLLGADPPAEFQLNTLGTVPGELTLAPSTQSVNAGSPATLTATATDSAGGPASGILVRFTASGANVAGGSATTSASGQAALSYTPTSGGTDTILAFEDLDGNGVRGSGEPQATATVTVAGSTSAPPPGPSGSADKTPPKVTLLVSSKVKLKKFLKGLSVAARVNETASLKLELFGSPPPVKKRAKTRARAFSRVLARQSLGMAGAGLRATRLRPSKKRVGTQKKFLVRLRVTATDRAGNKTVATRTIKVR